MSAATTDAVLTRPLSRARSIVLDYVGLSRVLSITVLLAGVNAILMTALATLGAFMYNMAASLVGGLHVTFTEDV